MLNETQDLAQRPQAEVAATIAQALGETEEGPVSQIAFIVRALGRTQACQLLEQTLHTEAAGGLMLPDSSRRRTAGGVFFHLAFTTGITKSGKKLHRFGSPPALTPKKPTPPAETTPKTPVPAFNWDERTAVIEEIGQDRGRATTVKITLIGTLGKYSDKGTCVVGVMQHTGEKLPALPKGVPTPQNIPTSYIVYIGAKQWKNVAAAADDPEDALIIEGFPQIDTKTGAISVFASNVSSKVRLARSRAAKAEEERQQDTRPVDN